MSARRLFRETFGRDPGAVVRTPGRINLIGEHIDYNGGTVLPTPTARGVEVAVGVDDQLAAHLTVVSGEFRARASRGLREAKSGHWSDYALGAARTATETGIGPRALCVAVRGDLPHGAGLSSSAALIVGLLKALYSISSIRFSDADIARQAQSVENDFIGVPCGIMDQMAVAAGREGEALALDTRTLTHQRIPIPSDWRFAIFHSGVTRALNDGRYALRRQECADAARELGVGELCQAQSIEVSRLSGVNPTLARRARHAVAENIRVIEAIEALRAGDAPGFGRLMNQSHTSLRDDFEVTTALVDAQAEASRAAGALGARMTGGGFGGCIVSLIHHDDENRWRSALRAALPKVEMIA